MADETELGLLCYKKNGVALCFKKSGTDKDKLVYKIDSGKETTVTFAWGSDVKDLDICAYWDGAPDMKVGYDYYTSDDERVSGHYHVKYSTDITSSNASEWVKIKMSPWGGGDTRTFRVHFNVYGYDADDYPGSTCTVIASQDGGNTLIKRGQSASTHANQPATTGDPFCIVTFDKYGNLESLE